MPELTDITWLPPWASSEVTQGGTVIATDDGFPWYCSVRPERSVWERLGKGLRGAHETLRAMSVSGIVEAIDETCNRWADRDFVHRARARRDIVAATGFSPEAVDRSLDVELGNYRAETLNRVLRRELGDPTVLDTFREDPELGGFTLAVGPRVTTVVCSGNVPGLPALSIVRALLVKSAVILKVASGEPSFAAHFLRSVAEVNPLLADAVVVTYWPGHDRTALREAVAQADAVIAYGSDTACAAVREHVQPHQCYIEHGHKVSAGVVTQDYLRRTGLDEAADRVADDVSTFNQHACIAPQAYLVERGAIGAHQFAKALARAMARYARTCPLGTVSHAEAAAIQIRRAGAAWGAASMPEGGFWCAPGLDWTVAVASDLTTFSGTGNRMVSVVPVTDLNEAVGLLRPLAPRLQNIGLGAAGAEFWRWSAAIARLGACRISEPGRMATPSVMWRHDGMPCLARMVSWCDIEMHKEARLRTSMVQGRTVRGDRP